MILNKQILGQLQESVDSLTKMLKNKEKLSEDLKKNLTEDELKEYTAIEKQVKKKLDNQDFNGAFRTIQKFKKHYESKDDSDESKEE